MQKFKFRLQTVLDQRKAIEDKLLGELGELRYREQEEFAKLESLHRELKGLWQRVTSKPSCTLAELRDADAYAQALADDIKVQELTIENLRRQIDEKLAEVVEASKDRKLIEKLKEKHYKEYQREVAAVEQKFLDELASVRFAREAA